MRSDSAMSAISHPPTHSTIYIHDVFLILISETEDKHRRATCKCVPLSTYHRHAHYICIIYVHNIMYDMTYENTLFYFVFRARTMQQ